MKTRTRRLMEIRKLIASSRLSNQDELLVRLQKKGFQYTQATLSRDLKYLKVGKIADPEKGMIYVLPEIQTVPELNKPEEHIPSTGFVSIDFSHNLGVIKTLPGFASSLAYAIDSRRPYEILGTIAGDDTILIISREGARKTDVIKALAMIIPDIES